MLHDKLGVNLPHHITQYIAPNLYELERLKGFDYIIGMGDAQGNTGGSFDNGVFDSDSFISLTEEDEL